MKTQNYGAKPNYGFKSLTLEDMQRQPYFEEEDAGAFKDEVHAGGDEDLDDDEMKRQALLQHIVEMRQRSVNAQGEVKKQNEQSRLISERMRNF